VTAHAYLTEAIRYEFGDDECRGLERFFREAASAGLLPKTTLRFADGPRGALAPCVDALKTLSAYGKWKKVAVIMENRGRTAPEELAQLIRVSGTYANPDIGNFPDEDSRVRGLRLLYPLSYNVSHVKMSPRFDFANAIRISKQMGFRGVYSIETGGPDPYAKVQTILDALLANM
jgi:hypothetical protein